MTEQEIMDMQRRIDAGIQLAQQRLWTRACHDRQSLVVTKNGRVAEIMPEESEIPFVMSTQGDPLCRRKK